MSRKTRRLIWSAPLVAVLAVAGALAIFATMAQGSVQAAHEMLPGAPQNVTIKADGHHAIKLSWDAPTSGGTPTGYRIDRSEDNGTWFTHEPMHTGTSYTDSGLDAGSTYFYRVFAYNTAGTGPVSEDRTETTDAATAPGRVRNLTATPTGQKSIMLTWQAPEKNGGAPIKHYEIHFAPNLNGSAVGTFPAATVLASAADDDTVIATDGPVLTHNHGELTAETRYRYIVYAVNDEDHKGTVPSAFKAAVTDKLTAPGRPDRLTAVHSDDTVVQLYWYAPADTGGTAITGYDTEVRTNCTGDWEDVDTPWTNVATSSHDALWNLDGTDREASACFRVRAHNSPSTTDDDDRRYGPWSGTTTLPLLDTDAARVLAVPPAVEDGEASYTTDRAKVTWTAADLDGRTADRISSYRVDVSEDGISWMRIPRCFSTNRADDNGDPFCEYAYEGGEPRTYRVLAQIAGRFGPSIDPFASTADDANVTAPGHVRNLAVTASGPTQIDLTWNAPTSDGGAPIDHYIVQSSMMGQDDFDPWPADLDTDTTGNFKSETTSYPHMKLKAGQTWRYRVFAVNKDADGDFLPDTTSLPANAGEAEVDQATTTQEDMPGKPEQLSVEMASTSNSVAAGSVGLLLLWNAPQNPAGADIAGYQVQRKKNDGQWATLSDSPHTGNTFTDFTDTDGLEEGETRAYQVRAISTENGVEGAWSETAYYPHDLLVPGKPTLSAMKDADMPGTKVKLTWTAPAMNADLVTGYIIERRHAGDMMGDIPSDGYNAGVMGASHAFMDYKEWWETLNCKGMLAVAGSSASDTATEGESAQDTADRDMYCKHFANTAPTNMAFAGKTVTEATAMKIKEMFMKRYVTDDMGKTMTMFTGMMHTDMGLMANTEYTYRVRAIHGMKAGMWSDKAMVTTTTDNTDPVDGPDLTATVTAGDMTTVQSTISDPDTDDTLTWATTTTSTDETIATATVNATTGMVTITGVAAGTATITVTAMDVAGASAMQDIAVTVTEATLGPPTDVRAEVDDSDPGRPSVTITWTNNPGADRHIAILFDSNYEFGNRIGTRQTDGSVTFDGVPSGDYIAAVISIEDDDNGNAIDLDFSIASVRVP